MALSASIDLREPSVQAEPSLASVGSNDAFSFWKPPQDWKASLDSSIAESRLAAEHYLFEGYLSARRSPAAEQDAGLLPDQKSDSAALRHRLNSGNQDAREPRIPAMALRKRARRLLNDFWLRNQPARFEQDRRLAYRILAGRDEMLHRADPRCRRSARDEQDGAFMADLEERYNFRLNVVKPAAGSVRD